MGTSNSFDNQEFINTFFIESKEMLQDMENAIIDIEKGEYDEEILNLIFRAAHSIKGSAGMFGFEIIEKFTHTVENVLDGVRKNKTEITSELISLLLECKDQIHKMLLFAEEVGGKILDQEISNINKKLVEHLVKYLPQKKEAEDKQSEEEYETILEEKATEDDLKVINECWHISIRPCLRLFCYGMDPQSLFRFLNSIGKIKKIKVVTDNLPAFNNYDPESCYIGFEIDFQCDRDKKEVENAFEFVKDDCKLRILPPNANISEYIELINDLPEHNKRVGEMLVEVGSLTELELEEVLQIQTEQAEKEKKSDNKKTIGEILLTEKMVQEPVLDAILQKQGQIRKKKKMIRIDAEKLDDLINLVGELVISGSNLNQLSIHDEVDKSTLTESVAVLSRLIEDIRDSTMNIRMVQIGETFKRYERIVRDLSRERNKEINLVISGGDTELDKTLIEKITDPLMHLVRNAIDHGIDMPEERLAKGKERFGTIYLNAYHETGDVVIEIIDDGDGLNREKIYSKAVENNLILSDQTISDDELFQYILEAGFSTAEAVTNISGRGVGMDVVRRNIESLRGSIVLESEEGKGTTVRIHLPLTLAIIDGFMVTVGDSYFVVPLDRVIECTEATKEELTAKDGGNYINLRGEVLPFMNLRDFFHEKGNKPEVANIVVVEYKGAKAGLVVDDLIGEFQTVIKPLGEIFNSLDWISGSTIIGTGEVAIILDVSMLIQNLRNDELNEIYAAG